MGRTLAGSLEGGGIRRAAGAFDAMSAKLVEVSGFDAVWAGSFAISATHALPDASILTMTEFLAAASRMADACSIPVIADCDTGFGGPGNVSHMVKKYEGAGIAAVCIEDKVFPKQNSLLEGGTQEMLPEKEFAAKLIAAREAKSDPGFMVIARTEALIAGLGTAEALSRATAYERAGADAILVHSKAGSPDELFEFCDAWKGSVPVVAVPTSYPDVSLGDLERHGVGLVIYANQSLRAAHRAMSDYLSRLAAAESLSGADVPLSSMEEIFKMQEMYEIKKQEREIEANLKKLGYVN
ncbi:Phosphonopyruvate hydrolase [Nitrosopumilaceae archaeon]|nr:isocitrate lyase/phosphoenolpyruvate mutase family protein [Nitrosopumilus sp.]MDA7997030.1 isocitrate lyase/phosphoenolpyruvate mutase family protein [Nitrosopumilus sp.]CAI9832567.1 Phosphonopyruvate hydrolase [Nitrosopumilaceae archaeon]